MADHKKCAVCGRVEDPVLRRMCELGEAQYIEERELIQDLQRLTGTVSTKEPTMEKHPYEPCDHPGRHGYTLPGDPGEYEFCERCRRGPEAHADKRHEVYVAFLKGESN